MMYDECVGLTWILRHKTFVNHYAGPLYTELVVGLVSITIYGYGFLVKLTKEGCKPWTTLNCTSLTIELTWPYSGWVGIKLIPSSYFPFICVVLALNHSNPTGIGLINSALHNWGKVL